MSKGGDRNKRLGENKPLRNNVTFKRSGSGSRLMNLSVRIIRRGSEEVIDLGLGMSIGSRLGSPSSPNPFYAWAIYGQKGGDYKASSRKPRGRRIVSSICPAYKQHRPRRRDSKSRQSEKRSNFRTRVSGEIFRTSRNDLGV